jgi:CRISPR-associated protein Cmr1
MFKETFQCKIITPMFLGGANQQAELRPPSIRGAMRWWFRAMIGENNIDNLKHAETDVFGNNNTSSKVVVRLAYQDYQNYVENNALAYYKLNSNYNPGIRRDTGSDAGLIYLLFTALRDRQFIKEGFSFDIKLSSSNPRELNEAVKSLWLLMNLGGIGLRSRRGLGNLFCQSTDSNESELQFIFNKELVEELKTYLQTNVSRIISTFSTTSLYSSIKGSTIYILDQTFDSWKKALLEIGKAYEEYRSTIRTNFFEGPNFGFPIIHSTNPKTRLISKYNNEVIDRRSSPLIFKIWSNRDQTKFFAGFVSLMGELIPDTHQLVEQIKNRNWVDVGSPTSPNPLIISSFLTKLKTISFTV